MVDEDEEEEEDQQKKLAASSSGQVSFQSFLNHHSKPFFSPFPLIALYTYMK